MKLKMKNNLKTLNWLALFAICFSLVLGASVQNAAAATKQKQSDKLKKKMSQTGSYEFIDVIIQPSASWTNSLTTNLDGVGAVKKNSYSNFNFQVYKVKQKDIDAIANRTDVDFVTLDDTVKTLGHMTTTTGAGAVRAINGSGTSLDGSGVGIVIVDSGVDPSHLSFRDSSGNSRIVYNQDFTGEGKTNDPYGHGTHVASIAAGVTNIAQGAYEGIAPNAKLINLRVLNSNGTGSISSILAALDWIYTNRSNATYNMKVVNLSLGANALDSYTLDPLCKAVRKLVDAGIVVVAAAGNEGKDGAGSKIYGQIHSPGNEPSAITVGAVNSFGTDARLDDAIATYSSRGPTRSFYTDALGVRHFDNLVKPDLVAPGNKIIDAQSYPGTYNNLVVASPVLDANITNSPTKEQMYLSGSSMATPAVSGAVALMLQANPTLTPKMVKMLLTYTAQTINGFNQLEQGAGELNIDGAVRVGKLVRRDLTAATTVGSPLLTTTTAPAPQSTIAGQTFGWGGGVIMDYSFATGSNLITQYQGIYTLGVLMSDGTIESNGVLMTDGTLMSDGVLMSDHILTGNGVLMSDGYPFLGCGVLMGDGVLMSDGVLMGDGVLMSDSVAANGIASQSSKALANGDATASMGVVADMSPDASPTSLTASAASKGQINLAWADTVTNESGFSIERCAGATCTNFAQVATVGANVKNFSNTGLTTATAYRYRVRAYNGGGFSFYTNIAAATTASR